MKPRVLFLFFIAVAAALAAGWWWGRHSAGQPPGDSAGSEARRILFYQSAMHPWIKSETPGKCTICGMDLTPVYEGETSVDLNPGLVSLRPNAISVLDVQTVPVQRAPLIRTLRVAGTIEENEIQHRRLSAYIGGRIESLSVNYVGAEVVAGQPLATFYSPSLLEAERQYLAILRTSSRIGSEVESERLLQSAALRLRQLGLTDAQVAQLPQKDPSNLFTEILAPLSGTVVERFVYPGQYVMEGEPLFELADFSTMWFLFDAYERDLPWIQLGLEVEITTPSLPGQILRAPIRFIDPNFNPSTRSTRVRVELPNPIIEGSQPPQRPLRHRLYAEGRVLTSHPDVLLVPRSAVLSPDGQPVVYVEQGPGTYERRPVQLGRVGDRDHEVLGGLEPGESVVIQGNLLIDAQAQLNLAIADTETPPPTEAHHDASDLPRLEPTQVEALQQYLAAADRLREALAADDHPKTVDSANRLEAALAGLTSALPPDHPWSRLLPTTGLAQTVATAPDLRRARQAYHPFSVTLVDLALQLRTVQPEFSQLRVYQCPMTQDAFDDAPRRSRWMQLAPPLRNPWYGAEMLDCGTEVRP